MKIKKLLLPALAIGLLGSASAQSVSTVAGAYYYGLGDDTWYDNTTMNYDVAKINFPYGIALDHGGRLYISDYYNNKLRLLTGNSIQIRSGMLGNMTSSMGYQDGASVGSGGGIMWNPAGIAHNPYDNSLILADQSNHAIRKLQAYSTAGNAQQLTTIAGDVSQLNTINGQGISGSSDGNALTEARFYGPSDVAVTSNGTIYVADRFNHTIRKVAGSTVSTIAGSVGVADHADGTGTAAKFNLPTGLCLENDNSLLVADFGNNCIRRIDLTTNAVTTIAGVPEVAGGNDGAAATAKFEEVTDVAAANGFIYIVDRRANTIRMLYNGQVSTIVGEYMMEGYTNGMGSTARLFAPRNIIFSPSDKSLYVSEEGNNVVRRIQLSPVVAFTASNTAPQVNNDITFTNNSSTGSYKWTITPNSFTLKNSTSLTSKDPVVSFNAAGAYDVKLVVDGQFGKDSIVKSAYILVSNTGSVGEFEAKNIKVYPNPGNGNFTFVPEGFFKNASISICNTMGQLVYEGNASGDNAVVDLSGKANGIYFVKIVDGNDVYYSKVQILN